MISRKGRKETGTAKGRTLVHFFHLFGILASFHHKLLNLGME